MTGTLLPLSLLARVGHAASQVGSESVRRQVWDVAGDFGRDLYPIVVFMGMPFGATAALISQGSAESHVGSIIVGYTLRETPAIIGILVAVRWCAKRAYVLVDEDGLSDRSAPQVLACALCTALLSAWFTFALLAGGLLTAAVAGVWGGPMAYLLHIAAKLDLSLVLAGPLLSGCIGALLGALTVEVAHRYHGQPSIVWWKVQGMGVTIVVVIVALVALLGRLL